MNFIKITPVLSLLILLSACNSKNNSIDVLKSNAKVYRDTANRYVYRSKSTIIHLKRDGSNINISLISKDRDLDLNILKCYSKSESYQLIETNSDNFGKHYIVTLTDSKKSVKLKCELDNGESFSKKIRVY